MSLPAPSTSLFRVLRHTCVPLLALAFGGACAAVPPAGLQPAPAEAQALPAPQDSERTAAEQALAEARQKLAEPDKALERAEEALRLCSEAKDPAGEMEALQLIGQAHIGRHDAEKAVAAFQEELSLAKQNGSRRIEARALKYLGATYADLSGNPKKGLEHGRAALAIWEEMGDEAEQMGMLSNIGAYLLQIGEYDAALQSYQRALTLEKRLGNEGKLRYILTGLGWTYMHLGNAEDAVQQFQQALALSRKAGDTGLETSALDGLGRSYRQGGHLQNALETYTESLNLTQKMKDPSTEAKLLYSLGCLYQDLGETDEALEYFQKSIVLQQSVGNKNYEVRALIEIARILLAGSDPTAALEALGQALARSREAEVQAIPTLEAAVLHVQGRAQLEQGDPQQALAALNESLRLRREIGDPIAEAFTRLDIGAAEQALGNLERAAAEFDRALETGQRTQATMLQMTALFRRARLERDRGDLRAASDRIGQALKLLESVRAGMGSDRLRLSFLASRQSYYRFSLDVLMRLDAERPGEGFAAAAFAISEQARSRALLDLLAEGRIHVEQGIALELSRQETAIGYRLSEVQRKIIEELSTAAPDQVKVASLQKDLDSLEDQREQLQWRFWREHPHYAEVRYPQLLELPAVQGLLDDRTALLEYALGEEGSYLFVVTRSGFQSHRLPEAGRLGDLVRQMRAGLEKPGRRNLGAYEQAAWQLYQELLAPAAGTLKGKRLVIAPDGVLHHLSFEALLTGPPGSRGLADLPYLVRDHAVSYVPSASVLASLRTPRDRAPASAEPPKQLLAFGDPVYSPEEEAGRRAEAVQAAEPIRGEAEEGERWRMPRLEGTGREVAEIARIYPPGEVAVYIREDASEENIKNNPFLASAHRIHIATHGVVDERRPELSGLVLTRGEGSPEDGVLQVYEVFNLSLNADLVVLSACETGLGKEVTGEGLVGLTRAFLYAGTPAVVVSLWRVADTSTPELMVRFYRGLDQDEDMAEALRRSKLAMIQGGGVRAHPYYWSPFVLVGAPEPAVRNVPVNLAPVSK